MDLIYRYDPYQPLDYEPPEDAQAAFQALADGNARRVQYVQQMQLATQGKGVHGQIVIPVTPISLGLPLFPGGGPPQKPFGVVLGCSDARAPVEHIFDQASNNLFVVRIAGNVLGTECLGSIDYAVRNLAENLKLIVVLGHTSCGAVTAAVDMYLKPHDYDQIAATYAVRSLVDRIMIAVRGAANSLQRHEPRAAEHPMYRAALLEAAIFVNAAITAFDVRREVSVLENAQLAVMFGVYDLDSQRVVALPGTEKKIPPLLTSPEKTEDLIALTDRAVEGVLAKGILSRGKKASARKKKR